jgi:hypothetical protein
MTSKAFTAKPQAAKRAPRRNMIDLTGQRFGRLLVLERALPSPSQTQAYWRCRCDCGNSTTTDGWSLRRGLTRSCGCLAREKASERARRGRARLRHGHARKGRYSKTYTCWCGMRQRCRDPNARSYPWYGARGITVCARWRRFENFLADMGERPRGKTLDRIDNDGNYEPGNCRWATALEQIHNRRKASPRRWLPDDDHDPAWLLAETALAAAERYIFGHSIRS